MIGQKFCHKINGNVLCNVPVFVLEGVFCKVYINATIGYNRINLWVRYAPLLLGDIYKNNLLEVYYGKHKSHYIYYKG